MPSDKGFLYYCRLTNDVFTITVWQTMSLPLPSDKGCLYYCRLTKDLFIVVVWQRIPWLLLSDKGCLCYCRLTKDVFTIAAWQTISLPLTSDKWCFYFCRGSRCKAQCKPLKQTWQGIRTFESTYHVFNMWCMFEVRSSRPSLETKRRTHVFRAGVCFASTIEGGCNNRLQISILCAYNCSERERGTQIDYEPHRQCHPRVVCHQWVSQWVSEWVSEWVSMSPEANSRDEASLPHHGARGFNITWGQPRFGKVTCSHIQLYLYIYIYIHTHIVCIVICIVFHL